MSVVLFLIAHSNAYHGLTLNEDEAVKRLAECGRTCQELLDQATSVNISQTTKSKLDSPGDVDAAEIKLGEATLEHSDAEEHPCLDWRVPSTIIF